MGKREKASGCPVQPTLQMPERGSPKEWGRAHLRGLKERLRGRKRRLWRGGMQENELGKQRVR